MTETEETLRYWLAQEDVYPSRYTQNFLRDTPPEHASDTLARIAADAQPEPHSYLAMIYTAFATIGFMPSAGGKIPRRKAGVRAALLLADRNDARCVAPLVRVFETDGIWQNRYQTQIVSALSRFLDYATTTEHTTMLAGDVAILARRLWNHAPNRDLTPGFARLLLAAVRFLQKESSTDSVLADIRATKTSLPRRRDVRETLVANLDNMAMPR